MTTFIYRENALVSNLIMGILLITALGIQSCSPKSQNKQSSSQRLASLERRIDSLMKLNDFEKAQPLALELNALKWEAILANPFWKERPYAKILIDLSKVYVLTNYEDFVPASTDSYKTILQIFPISKDPENLGGLKWNMEDVNKIKVVIMKTLPFEPEVGKNSKLTWTASKYEIEVYETGSGHLSLDFLTKQQ
jgi:hypothetical protein